MIRTMAIHTLDLNFQNRAKTIAAYLIIGPDGPVLVETGPGSTRETLRLRLEQHGVALSDLKHVLVTHIHLDHSGAAGWLAQQGAHIYVHHVGASHLIDPSRLLRSARRIYGDELETLWGETLPVPAEQVTPLYDNDVIEVSGLRFIALDSPGHAGHHHCYRLGDVAFTGDAAGVRQMGVDLVNLPAPPPEFNPEAWERTIDRLLGEKFTAIYPTHFGRIEDVSWQLTELREIMHQAVEFVRDCLERGMDRDAIADRYVTWMHERAFDHGLSVGTINEYETSNPSRMSVDGIMRYWRKRGL